MDLRHIAFEIGRFYMDIRDLYQRSLVLHGEQPDCW